MKPEQDGQFLSLSKRGRQPEQLSLVDVDEFDEVKKRGLDLSPVWRIIQRNVFLITGITTLVALSSLYSVLNSSRKYEGNFRLLVEPITSEAKFTDPSVLSRDGKAPAQTNAGVDYPSLLQILQSPRLLSVIAKRVQTRYPDVTYDSLSKDLVIERIGTNLVDSTKLIEVRYEGEDPEEVQFVLSETAKEYLKYSLDDRTSHIGEGVRFIENQLPSLQQRVNNLQLQMQALQQEYKLIDPTTDAEELSKQVREIQAQKLESQRQIQEQRKLYASLQRQLGLKPNQAIATSTLSEEPRYQELLGQLKKVESQIAVESGRFSENNPVIKTLREQQQNLSLLLNQEAQRILGQSAPSIAANPQVLTFQNSTRLDLIKQLADTVNQLQVLEGRNQALANSEATLGQQVQQFAANIRRYDDLKSQLEVATTTLNQLLLQRETLRVEAAQNQVPWEVISEPRIARDTKGNLIPVSSGNPKKLAMGVIGGFLLGLLAAVMKEKYRNVFYSTEDIQNATKLPILGVIPFDKSGKQFSNYSAVVGSTEESKANFSNDSLFMEAFSSLYTSIRFLSSDPPVRSLVVSSASPGDGKTTIALHLAQTAAGMARRVLLIDANLRQPQLHTRLGLSNLEGLSNLLSQNLEPNALIQRSHLEDNLFVLTSGQHSSDSTKLLASPKMQHLMEQFETAFDLVIYDTPHLLGIADANLMAENTDGFLMVVGVGKTNVSEIMQVVNGVNTFRLPILGMVANHVARSIKSSYGYYNRYHEKNHPVHSNLENQPKILEPDLRSAAENDRVVR